MSGHPRKLFFATATVFIGYYVIFAANLVISYLSTSLLYEDNSKTKYSKVLILNVTMLTYQGYACGSMITFYIIHSRLAIMNDFIEKSKIAQNRELLKVLKIASIFNDKVCDTLESIKVTSSISTAMYCIQGSFFAVLSNYSFISYHSNKDATLADKVFFITVSNWSTYYSVFLFWTCYYSYELEKEGERFKTIAQSFLASTSRKEFHKRVQLIHLQLLHRRPRVECGLFNIDPKVQFYFASLCFSYIIIIVQFDSKHFSN